TRRRRATAARRDAPHHRRQQDAGGEAAWHRCAHRRAEARTSRGRRRGGHRPLVKALLLTREYPPHIYGGAGVVVGQLAEALGRLMPVEVRCFGERAASESTARIALRGYTPWDRVGPGPDKALYVP